MDGYQEYLKNETDTNNSWDRIENSERAFIECEGKIKLIRCPIHKKRGYAEWSYEEDYETHAWVRKACCMGFANEIAQLLRDTNAFSVVYIDLGWPHTKKPNA